MPSGLMPLLRPACRACDGTMVKTVSYGMPGMVVQEPGRADGVRRRRRAGVVAAVLIAVVVAIGTSLAAFAVEPNAKERHRLGTDFPRKAPEFGLRSGADTADRPGAAIRRYRTGATVRRNVAGSSPALRVWGTCDRSRAPRPFAVTTRTAEWCLAESG